MKELIDKINPPGIEKTNRKKLFNILEKLGDLLANDAWQSLSDFFPLLATEEALNEHGKALAIPRYEHDTEDSYRQRVAAASFFLQQRGEKAFFKSSISQRFNDRPFQIIEEFMRLTLKVLDMTNLDRNWIYEFLGKELDPNIEIRLIDWFDFVERFELSEEALFNLNSFNVDTFEKGFSYNGQSLYNHGKFYKHDGSLLYNSSINFDGFRQVLGTWRNYYIKENLYNGNAQYSGLNKYYKHLNIPTDLRTNSATFQSTSQDEINYGLGAKLEDINSLTIEFRGGGIRFDGTVNYIGNHSEMIDSLDITVIGG
ncbi:MAG: hypothetical protein ACPKOI_05820 [Pleomorphochaeta sp.]